MRSGSPERSLSRLAAITLSQLAAISRSESLVAGRPRTLARWSRAILQRLSPGTTRWLVACSRGPCRPPSWPSPGWPCPPAWPPPPPGGLVVEVVGVGSVVVGGGLAVVVVVDIAVVAGCSAAELLSKLKAV